MRQDFSDVSEEKLANLFPVFLKNTILNGMIALYWKETFCNQF